MQSASHPLAQRYVLDTSAFVTDEIRRDDEEMVDAVARLTDLIRDARRELAVTCYYPPSIADELATILDGRDGADAVMADLDAWMTTRSPATHGEQVPAQLVYRFVDEMSDRVNKGLRVAEKAVRDAEEASDETVDDSDYVTETDAVVSRLRDEYRAALRQGVLDSREDFDLVMLGRELDASVVTEDRGVIAWCEELGVGYVRGEAFPERLERHLSAGGSG